MVQRRGPSTGCTKFHGARQNATADQPQIVSYYSGAFLKGIWTVADSSYGSSRLSRSCRHRYIRLRVLVVVCFAQGKVSGSDGERAL